MIQQNAIISKLDRFVRKYYQNELLKGAIYSFTLTLALSLLVILMEYVGQFGTEVRTTLFFSYIAGLSALLGYYVIRPLLQLFRIGKTLSYEQASMIIGNHFPEVKDKLLNTLQLQNGGVYAGNSLAEASINQRIAQLNPIPFHSVVDFKKNLRLLRFAAIPVGILTIILLVNAGVLVNSTKRLVNFDTEYLPEAPFQFALLNNNMEVLEQEPFEIRMKVTGNQVPALLTIHHEGKEFRMQKVGPGEYSYVLNPRKSFSFRVEGNGFFSQTYQVNVLPKPVLRNFDIKLNYPEYTGRKDETVHNSGDLIIPEGTLAEWQIATKNTSNVYLNYGDSVFSLQTAYSSQAVFRRALSESTTYSIISENKYVRAGDSIIYSVQIIKDQFPTIAVSEKSDSTDQMIRYFMGDMSDDYGLASLICHVRVTKKDGSVTNKRIPVPFGRGLSTAGFTHFVNLHELGLSPGETVEYYFSVSDNDGVNGSKTTTSQVRMYKAPTEEELKELREQTNQKVKDSMEDMLSDVRDFQKEMQEFREELQTKRTPDWKQKQQLEELMKEQKRLREKTKEMNEEFKKDLEQQNEFDQLNEELLEKKEMLEKLMEELMTDEMKDMLEELQRMMEEFNKEEMNEKLEDFKFDMEDYEKQLDRALEQFKQMEFDEKLNDIQEQLKDLQQEQQDLQERTESKDQSAEELKKEQDQLNNEFDELTKELEELDKMNQELENKRDMEGMDEMKEQVQEEMKNSSDQLQQGKEKKASQNQQKASDQMQQMLDKMQSMQTQSQQQQAEDMDALRDLLENIVTLSFDQEALIEEMNGLSRNDPKYFEIGKEQRKLRDDAGMVRDSLFALSKRVPQIQSFVNKEISEINRGMDRSLDAITGRDTRVANAEQQTAMTSLNNLALMLSETLDQMQQQMASMMPMPGSGSCTKPGGMSPKPMSSPSMQQMQDQLKKQMEKMKSMMEQGKSPGPKQGEKPGGEKPGSTGQGNSGPPGGNKGMSEQLAKMAAEQAALREAIKKMRQELNMDGSGRGNGLQEVEKQLEQNEEDLIKKNINLETLMRQQDILTRLLEHERAERERGWDEKRESNEGKDELKGNPERYFEYNRRKLKEVELLRTIPPDLKPYYRKKVNDYFNLVY